MNEVTVAYTIGSDGGKGGDESGSGGGSEAIKVVMEV